MAGKSCVVNYSIPHLSAACIGNRLQELNTYFTAAAPPLPRPRLPRTRETTVYLISTAESKHKNIFALLSANENNRSNDLQAAYAHTVTFIIRLHKDQSIHIFIGFWSACTSLSHSAFPLCLPSPPSLSGFPVWLPCPASLSAPSLRPPSLRSLTLPFLSALPLCLPSLHSLSTSPSSHSDFLFHLFFFTFLLYLPSLPYSSTFLFSCPLCSAFHLSVPLYTSSLCSLSDFTCLSIPVMYIKS